MATKQAGPPNEVRISDLQLASFLLARDYSLLRTDGNGRRIGFVFANVPEEEIFRFYQGDCLVNARKLLDSHRNLKGLLLQQDDRGRR